MQAAVCDYRRNAGGRDSITKATRRCALGLRCMRVSLVDRPAGLYGWRMVEATAMLFHGARSEVVCVIYKGAFRLRPIVVN